MTAAVARREDWPVLPCPVERAAFELPMRFTEAEVRLIRRGLVPQGSDDRWFIYVEDDALFCHRSWTGACIFGAKLVADAGGTRLTNCWASRDNDYYESGGMDCDRDTLKDLLVSHFSLDTCVTDHDIAGDPPTRQFLPHISLEVD